MKVIDGDPRLESSFLPSTDVERRHALGYEFVSGTTHFLPLENPTRCVNRMMAFLEERGLVDSAAPAARERRGGLENHREGGNGVVNQPVPAAKAELPVAR